MTAKEDKINFISHYLEDWIPETKMSETIERLDEVIESYCRERPTKLNDSTSEPLPDAYLDTLIKRVEGHKHTVFHPHDSFLAGWNKSIDIILDDLRCAPVEVCEWYRSRLIDTCYYPDCIKFINSNSIIDRENYIYCPFCGRKIKRI